LAAVRAVFAALCIALTACGSSTAPPAATLTPPETPTATTTPTAGPSATASVAASRCVEEGGELRYASGTTTVRGAFLRPQGSGPFPAALVLHTRGGLNEHTRSEASWLASQGFIAYAPDYFTPVGVTPLSFDRQTFTLRYSDAVRDLLAGAISCLRERGDVERSRVGVVGFSMGGYFAAVLAARDDVNAAAAWYAAYAGSPANNVPAQHSWSDVAAAAKRPLLLLHGDADQDVRIDFARRAGAELQRLGKRSELVVYPGAGHGYDQQGSSQYAYDAAATADSRARTLAWLRAAR
jgi:carboxymethylenebutenolidase